MPADLAQLLHRAALWSLGGRRRGRRRLALGLTAVAVAVVSITAIVAARFDRPERERTANVVTEDAEHGFTVEHPGTWNRAPNTLTPALANPVEILSLGTGDLPAGGRSCAHLPVAAMGAMSPTDALVTVQERLPPAPAERIPGEPSNPTAGFPPRPDEFPPRGSKNVSEAVHCLDEPPVPDHWWFGFEDAGRGFHVLVAIGTQASDRTRAEAWAILDSLRFEPRRRERLSRLAWTLTLR